MASDDTVLAAARDWLAEWMDKHAGTHSIAPADLAAFARAQRAAALEEAAVRAEEMARATGYNGAQVSVARWLRRRAEKERKG